MFVNIDAALEQIHGWAETDGIGLWEIVAYVQEESGTDDSERLLELTVALVKGLLQRGLRAGLRLPTSALCSCRGATRTRIRSRS